MSTHTVSGRVARGTAIAVGLAGALALWADSARAAFPGANGRIAYNSGAPALPVSNTSGVRIFSSKADGTGTKNLTPGLNFGEDFFPSFSPNGQRIGFHSQRSGATEVWTMRDDGAGARQITSSGNTGELGDATPSYSPNGSQIVFTCGGQICKMNADGTRRRPITNPPGGRYDDVPVWAPNGGMVAFVRRSIGGGFGDEGDCHAVALDGSNERQLATDCGNPDFAPNGKQILFSSSRTGFELLFLMRRNGTNEHRIQNTRDMSDPVFSPNGKRIAATDFVGGDFEIFNIRRDGTQRVNISTNPGRADTEPTWQPR